MQIYRAAGGGEPAAQVIEELVRRATETGWTFDPAIPGLAELAHKHLGGVTADLTVGLLSDRSEYVVLTLKASPSL